MIVIVDHFETRDSVAPNGLSDIGNDAWERHKHAACAPDGLRGASEHHKHAARAPNGLPDMRNDT